MQSDGCSLGSLLSGCVESVAAALRRGGLELRALHVASGSAAAARLELFLLLEPRSERHGERTVRSDHF